MADETKQGETPEQQATETEAAKPQEETKTATVEELQAERERLARALQNKTEEAERVHKKLEAFEEAERKRKEAEMSELEKLQARNEELQKQAQKAEESAMRRAIEAEVIRVSANLEYADPTDALHLIDLAKVEMTDGKIKGVEDQLQELAKSKPYLLKKTSTSLRATNPGATKQGETDAERRKRLLG